MATKAKQAKARIEIQNLLDICEVCESRYSKIACIDCETRSKMLSLGDCLSDDSDPTEEDMNEEGKEITEINLSVEEYKSLNKLYTDNQIKKKYKISNWTFESWKRKNGLTKSRVVIDLDINDYLDDFLNLVSQEKIVKKNNLTYSSFRIWLQRSEKDIVKTLNSKEYRDKLWNYKRKNKELENKLKNFRKRTLVAEANSKDFRTQLEKLERQNERLKRANKKLLELTEVL